MKSIGVYMLPGDTSMLPREGTAAAPPRTRSRSRCAPACASAEDTTICVSTTTSCISPCFLVYIVWYIMFASRTCPPGLTLLLFGLLYDMFWTNHPFGHVLEYKNILQFTRAFWSIVTMSCCIIMPGVCTATQPSNAPQLKVSPSTNCGPATTAAICQRVVALKMRVVALNRRVVDLKGRVVALNRRVVDLKGLCDHKHLTERTHPLNTSNLSRRSWPQLTACDSLHCRI